MMNSFISYIMKFIYELLSDNEICRILQSVLRSSNLRFILFFLILSRISILTTMVFSALISSFSSSALYNSDFSFILRFLLLFHVFNILIGNSEWENKNTIMSLLFFILAFCSHPFLNESLFY